MSDKSHHENAKGKEKEIVGVSGTPTVLQQLHSSGTSAKEKRKANQNERAMRLLSEEVARFKAEEDSNEGPKT
jgi:hypothetical protein